MTNPENIEPMSDRPISNSVTDGAAESTIVDVEPAKVLFEDLSLSPPILKALQDMGFEHCSPIQAQSLPHSLVGNDVLGKAQTGTGKTAAFLIALFEDLLRAPPVDDRYAGEGKKENDQYSLCRSFNKPTVTNRTKVYCGFERPSGKFGQPLSI